MVPIVGIESPANTCWLEKSRYNPENTGITLNFEKKRLTFIIIKSSLIIIDAANLAYYLLKITLKYDISSL